MERFSLPRLVVMRAYPILATLVVACSTTPTTPTTPGRDATMGDSTASVAQTAASAVTDRGPGTSAAFASIDPEAVAAPLSLVAPDGKHGCGVPNDCTPVVCECGWGLATHRGCSYGVCDAPSCDALCATAQESYADAAPARDAALTNPAENSVSFANPAQGSMLKK